MKTIINCLIITAIVAFAILRPMITPRLALPTATGCYEAFAHLFVGGLFGAWLLRRTEWLWLGGALGLSLVELFMFLIQKSRG